MGIQRIDFQPLDPVPEDDVIAVIGKGGPGVDVSNAAISRRHDGIGGLTPLVALETSNIEALVHLPAIAAHTTKTTAGPAFAHGPDEKPFLSARLEQGVIGGWQLERFGAGAGQ